MRQLHLSPERFFLYVGAGRAHAAFHTNPYWLSRIPVEQVDIPALDVNAHPVSQYRLMAKVKWLGEHAG